MKRILTWIVAGVLLAGLLVFVGLLAWAFDSRSMSALRIWHTTSLSNEFTASDATPQSTLQDYLDREGRLFRELKEKVYDRVKPADDLIISRYSSGGPQDPERWQRNWNRTFELVPKRIRGGALLMHGLTDSPYSLRRIGEILHAKGFYVLGLRLPGHGTVPEALTEVHWKDWVAASRIGARHVRERIGEDKPFVIAGYSNGGALTVKYALDALSDSSLPRPDRLLLFSPEIGISRVAFMANWHKLFSFLPYFAKSKWLSIQPEYDPFKYNSFPKNAGQQSYNITRVLQKQIEKLRKAGSLADFPPVLTFMSRKDATVEGSATVRSFYNRLENNNSELVIFNVNNFDRLAALVPATYNKRLKQLLAHPDLPYRLTVVTNVARESRFVAERTKAPRSKTIESTPLGVSWPIGVFSLSHVAIPFPPDDPVYGAAENTRDAYDGIPLGSLQPRGENRLLTVPLNQLIRLRHNPFFAYMERRVMEAIDDTLKRNPGTSP